MNRNVKVFCASLLVGLALLPFAACGNKDDTGKKDEFNISLSETMIEMNVGETYELKVTITPDDPMDKAVEWKSSDDGIASVEKGTVTAKAEGEATITATSNGQSDTCKVTVKPAETEEDNKPDDGNNGGNGNEDQNPDGETPENGDENQKPEENMPDGETPENGPEENP